MIKNRLILNACKLRRGLYKYSQNKELPLSRILILSTTGLGDTLWATPALRALKKSFPNVAITVLTSPIGKDLLLHNPYIDTLLTIKNPVWSSLPKLYNPLIRNFYDTLFVFHVSQRLTLPLALWSLPSQIIGSQGDAKGLDSLFTTIRPKIYEHEIHRRLALVATIGTQSDGDGMEIFFTQDEESTFESLCSSLLFDPAPLYIGLHPGSKDGFKRWNPEHFIAVGTHLHKTLGAKIVITGSADEAFLTHSIATQIPESIDIAGKLSIRQTALLLKKLNYYISNDTGTMHLALTVNTPTLGIFSPTDPQLCGPLNTPHGQFLYKKPTCTPCIKRSCQASFCLEQISPLTVINMVTDFLSARSS